MIWYQTSPGFGSERRPDHQTTPRFESEKGAQHLTTLIFAAGPPDPRRPS